MTQNTTQAKKSRSCRSQFSTLFLLLSGYASKLYCTDLLMMKNGINILIIYDLLIVLPCYMQQYILSISWLLYWAFPFIWMDNLVIHFFTGMVTRYAQMIHYCLLSSAFYPSYLIAACRLRKLSLPTKGLLFPTVIKFVSVT